MINSIVPLVTVSMTCVMLVEVHFVLIMSLRLVSSAEWLTVPITVMVILWPVKLMLLYGRNTPSRKAGLQFVDFVVFFNVQESVRIGSHRIHDKWLRRMMIYILLMRSTNTTFSPIVSIV